ncbi:MAG: apolipoprotein N-acyltransferase [Myxococcales bacterium]|nr:apolipoprotein N-acyltransferase [Myxococcales bacterium]
MSKRRRKAARRPPRERAGAVAPVEQLAHAPEALPRALWPSYLLAALSGALYFLSYPGWDLWPLAFVAFVPFFFAVERARAAPLRHTIGLGFVAGFVEYAGGYYWLVPFFEKFSGFGVAANTLFAAVFWAYLGAQMLLVAWAIRRIRERGWPALPAFLAVLLASEFAYPQLFPSYLANSFHQVPWLMQTADLGGPMLVSTVPFLTSIALYELLAHRRADGRLPRLSPILAAVALALTLGYGAYRIHTVDARVAAAPKLSVGTVQANIGIQQELEDPFEGLRRHQIHSLQLEREAHPDLIVWPESSYMWLLPEGAHDLGPRVMDGLHTPLLFGGTAQRRVDGKPAEFNTAYLLSRDGALLGTYDKIHLLAFGEYMPLGKLFPILYRWSPNTGRLEPGTHVRPLHLGPWRLTILICYEDVLPRFTRDAVREGNPHLLINMTNDAWFGRTVEPWVHLNLAQLRAVENRRYLVRATLTGVSAVIDPAGRVVAHTDIYDGHTLVHPVAMLDGHTVYEWAGDWPGWLGLLATLALAFGPPRDRVTSWWRRG